MEHPPTPFTRGIGFVSTCETYDNNKINTIPNKEYLPNEPSRRCGQALRGWP